VDPVVWCCVYSRNGMRSADDKPHMYKSSRLDPGLLPEGRAASKSRYRSHHTVMVEEQGLSIAGSLLRCRELCCRRTRVLRSNPFPRSVPGSLRYVMWWAETPMGRQPPLVFQLKDLLNGCLLPWLSLSWRGLRFLKKWETDKKLLRTVCGKCSHVPQMPGKANPFGCIAPWG
jgi:hypothetical protein